MNTKSIIAFAVAVGVSLGLLYVLDITVFGGKSDIWQNVIKLTTVLIVVGIASWVTKMVIHKEGIKLQVEH